MSWTKVESFAPLWKPKVGEELEGIVKSVGKVKIVEKESDQYLIELSIPCELTIRDSETEDSTPEPVAFDKGTIITMPAHAMLTKMLSQASMNDKVKIVMTKEIPSKVKGKNAMNFYEVWIDKQKK